MTPAQFWQIEQQNQQNRQEFMQGQQENLMQAIGQFAGQFAENKALDAKGAAYKGFLKNHGQQLGLDGEYLDSLYKMKDREVAFIGDNIIGMQNMGNWLVRDNYARNYMTPQGGNRLGAGGRDGGGMLHNFDQ